MRNLEQQQLYVICPVPEYTSQQTQKLSSQTTAMKVQSHESCLPFVVGSSQKEEAKPSPAGAFNPYGVTDEHWLKAGKRSAVNPRSGNRSQTFAGQ